MKKKPLILTILVILVLATAVLAILHLNTRESIPQDTLVVTYQGKTKTVDLDQMTLIEVSGTIVNGKGEEKYVDAKGIPIFSLITERTQTATVRADDEYSAAVGIEDAENAYLILNEDGSFRLIVFGDTNSKRDVKHVVKVEFR